MVYGLLGIPLMVVAALAGAIFDTTGLILAANWLIQFVVLIALLFGCVQALRGREYPLFLVGGIAKRGADWIEIKPKKGQDSL